MERDRTADLVILNGDVRTMDALVPRASAVAIRHGKILAVGSNEDMREHIDKATRAVDAGGRLVLPGFQDTHLHLQDSGTDRAFLPISKVLPASKSCSNSRGIRPPEKRRRLDPGRRLVFWNLRRTQSEPAGSRPGVVRAPHLHLCVRRP